MYQRKRAWERNEEIYLEEKAELTRELKYYKDKHEAVTNANHKMLHRQAAAEGSVMDIINEIKGYEIPAGLIDKLDKLLIELGNLSEEYQDMVGRNKLAKLPSTNIKAVDDLLMLFAHRFAENDIQFNLKVNGSIVYMADKVIAQNKLETMIGDHLQDSLNAINAGSNTLRNVLAMIGEARGCYEFSVWDSGIPFEVDTLVRLGTGRVTTRAEEGGSGIGFMTTFETMRECRASLIIRDNPPESSFSKSVSIRFDGENKYIIETYRADDFPASERYIIKRI